MKRRFGLWSVWILSLSIFIGCAQIDKLTGKGEDSDTAKTEEKSVEKKAAEKEEFVKQDIPASSPLSKISQGMDSSEVRVILGRADLITRYRTGMRWIPFAGRWLNDARRQSWFYEKMGYVILSKNKYTGQYAVKKVHYDPNQTAP